MLSVLYIIFGRIIGDFIHSTYRWYMTFISVIVPTLNRNKEILFFVNTLKRQTIPVQELIVVDAGEPSDLQSQLVSQQQQVVYPYGNQGISLIPSPIMFGGAPVVPTNQIGNALGVDYVVPHYIPFGMGI